MEEQLRVIESKVKKVVRCVVTTFVIVGGLGALATSVPVNADAQGSAPGHAGTVSLTGEVTILNPEFRCSAQVDVEGKGLGAGVLCVPRDVK